MIMLEKLMLCSLILISSLSACDKEQINNDNPSNIVKAETVANPIFQEPVGGVITSPNEFVRDIYFTEGDVEELQRRIDEVRAGYADAVLIVHIRGAVKVKSTPLTIGSKVCLSFESCGSLVVENTGSCPAIIHIKDAEYVSIAAKEESAIAVLNGNNIAEKGILVTSSGKVNIDNLNIYGCKEYGIYYTGRGESFLNDAGSVTRCYITGTSNTGVKVNNAARFVMMDNVIADNTSFGIDVVSQSATIVGNICKKNQTGLFVGASATAEGPGGVVARNTLKSNSIGLELANNTKNILVTENEIVENSKGMVVDGYRNHIFSNEMNNSSQFEVRGIETVIERHKNVTASDVAGGTDTRYFNPPTIDNPHSESEIVLGMGRRDLSFTQNDGESDLDLSVVQAAINQERESYPNDVVVVWLKGTFVAKGDHTGIDMPENTCVVLDGTIYPQGAGMDRNSDPDHYSKSKLTGGTQLVLMKENGFASFSGGVLDCKRLCAYGIYAPGSNVGLIDSVSISSAVDNNIGVLNHKGSANPMMIRGCHLDGQGSTNRGVWVHVCSYINCISNVSENHVADYVDIDAVGHYNKVVFSRSTSEKRTGVFIEEKASNNMVVCNEMKGALGNGVSLYCANGGQCSNNIIVANEVNGPNGINIRHANNTLSFNNVIKSGRYGVYLNVTNNYSSQNCVTTGSYNYSDVPGNPIFTVPYYDYVHPDNQCGL